MLFYILMAQAAPSADQVDIENTAQVAALCRRATAAAESSGDAVDWLNTIDRASAAGSDPTENQKALLKLCVMYSHGVRDTAQTELDRTLEELDKNSEELKALLKQ